MEQQDQDNGSETVVHLTSQLEKLVKDFDVADVILAMGVVAARRSRRAGGSEADFMEDMKSAWKASIQR